MDTREKIEKLKKYIKIESGLYEAKPAPKGRKAIPAEMYGVIAAAVAYALLSFIKR